MTQDRKSAQRLLIQAEPEAGMSMTDPEVFISCLSRRHG